MCHDEHEVKFNDDKRHSSQTLPMLACWVNCCEASVLSCGRCWHDDSEVTRGEGSLLPHRLDPVWHPHICLEQQEERTSSAADCSTSVSGFSSGVDSLSTPG